MWKKVLREYFAYSRKERRGLLLLFMAWLFLLTYQFIQHNDWDAVYSPITYQINYADEVRKYDSLVYIQSNKFESKKLISFPKYFNYASIQDFESYGLSYEQSLKLISLRNGGLKIFTLDDLLQCKEMDSTIRNTLKPHLKFFPDKKYFRPNEVKNATISSVNINTADTLEIDQIKGISKGLAKRIYNYRERLGGFIRKEQLQEVWGMDSASYHSLEIAVTLNRALIKPININTADINLMGKHPYIGYNLAKIIVNYRNQHGPYQKVEDLFNIHVMNADIFSKIEAYISINEH